MQVSNCVPNHIAVILDGNRRWAKSNGLPVWEGHRKGAENFEKFLNWSLELGIPRVSAYVLSTENLNRPKNELRKIYDIMCESLSKWIRDGGILDKHEVKVNFIGDLNKLPARLLRLIRRMIHKTSKYSKKILNIMVAYGSKLEITQAVKSILSNALKTGKIQITQKDIEKNLAVKDEVDLVIRTGGMSRLSNFLLWQTAYSEMYVTKTMWPDFSKTQFMKAIEWYASTQRNFGK